MFTAVLIFWKYLWFFSKRGREGERERNIHVWEKHPSVASCTPPTGDPAHNPGLCPDQESNQQPFGSQAGAQSTEPHQPELFIAVLLIIAKIWKQPKCPSTDEQIKKLPWLVWLSWLEVIMNGRTVGLIPSQAACPGCGFGPPVWEPTRAPQGTYRMQSMFLSHTHASLPFSLLTFPSP